MRFTLRSKLFAIAGTTALAFVLLIVANTLVSSQVTGELTHIRESYLPKVEAGPRLERAREALTRGFQDAVSAKDLDTLEATRQLKDTLLAELAQSRQALDPAAADALRTAVDDYYGVAFDLSKRLIAGETGEGLVDAIAQMQTRQRHVAELLTVATTFDRGELSAAFSDADTAQRLAARVELGVSLATMLLVLLLITWVGRGLLGSVNALTTGLEKIGTGAFDVKIQSAGEDELAEVAAYANQMSANLKRLAEQRDRDDWLKAGLAGLLGELRGDVTAAEAASRACAFLARYLDAPAAALYFREGPVALKLIGSYAATPPAEFRAGEGLVGQAALQTGLTVIQAVPPQYLQVKSGLGESTPSTLALLPLVRGLEVRGVLEVGLFKDWSEASRDLLFSVREALTISLEVCLARERTTELLHETQNQAMQLAAQENELRATNEELQTQSEELKQSNEELTEQAEELEAQRTVLEERNLELESSRKRLELQANELATVSSYKSQFLTNMSHELRTPLNSMLLLSNLMAENAQKNLTPKQVEFCETIHSAGKDLLALINQVLDLAKVESGKQELRITHIALSDVVTRARRVFEPLAKDKKLALEIEVSPQVPFEISSDRQRVDQIVTNLLGNAIKFTSKGKVTLKVDPREGGGVSFFVTDTGPGIAAEHRERIFAPFEQVDGSSDRKHGGTGLGLAIARELALLLGGELALVETSVGRGSTFALHLPAEATGAPRAQLATVQQLTALPASGEPLLLLIEDDRLFAETFGEVIESQGIKQVRASDGASGLRLAEELQPHGIILDVKLPDMNGFTLMEKLRANPKTAHIPVHFVSSMPAAERGLAMGAVGYVTKPATRAELLRVVQTLSPGSIDGINKVLIVEDDRLTSESLQDLLHGEALESRHASTAAEALTALSKERFGCVIVDLSLPDMDGLELLERMQEQAGAKMPSVVVYTGRALSRAETTRIEAYADAIVLKEGPAVERLLAELRLFVRRMKEGRSPRRSPALDTQLTSNVKLTGKRVLVVDDDMRTVYALSAMLQAKGAEIFVADNGQAGLEALAAQPNVDAVLMDIMMPEMDGYEAMRRIRLEPRFANLPIIALTAKAMKGDEEKCIAAGATAYLSKPIAAERLLPLLQTHLTPP